MISQQRSVSSRRRPVSLTFSPAQATWSSFFFRPALHYQVSNTSSIFIGTIQSTTTKNLSTFQNRVNAAYWKHRRLTSCLTASALAVKAVMGVARRSNGMMRRPSRAHSFSVLGPDTLHIRGRNAVKDWQLHIVYITVPLVPLKLLEIKSAQKDTMCMRYFIVPPM